MPVKVTVESVLAGKDAFETAKRNAEELNKNLRGQFAERERIIKLQARLSQASSREEKAAIRAEIAERRRGLQLVALKEREEKAVTRELKQQISSQQRLNRLTEKLNRDLAKEKQQRSLLGRAQAAVGGAGGALLAGAGIAGAGLVASQLLDQAQAAAEAGRAQQEARARLTQLLGSTEKYNEAIKTMNELTTVQSSEVENANAAFLLLDSGIAKSVDEAARLSNAGNILSQNFEAQGASQEKFLRLLSSGNDVLLDNFNLTKEQVNARKEQIQATTGLSENEAKLQAVRELAVEKADELASSISDAAKATAEWDSATADFKATLGEGLIPLFEDAKSGAADALTWVNDWLKSYRTDNIERNREALIKMGADVEKVNEHFDKQLGLFADVTTATNENTDAIEDNADAQDAAAKAAEEAAKRLEKVQQIQRDFAGSLLDISERAQEDSAEQWKDYYADLEDLTGDYGDRVTDLEEKAGKDRIAIGKKLRKDLTKLDSDLNKDREKITADTDKKIKRLKEDAAREQKQDRRKRQIDTAGDERLFNFELQQLAAEGEALQIQEAQKRREIEKQINAEKQQEDAQQESSDLDLKIQRLKQDAQDRIREEEAQARDRREFLKAQAEEDRQQLAEDLQERKEAEFENLQERLDKLKESNAEKLRNIEETRIKANQKLGEELAEAGDLTRSELEKLKPVAGKLGEDVGAEFAQGLSSGFERNEQIGQLLGSARQFRQSRSFQGSAGARAGFGGATPGSLVRGFQHGGDFIVGGAGGPDSQLVAFRASPGEAVSVRPPGQAGGGINITIPISGVGGGVSEAQVEAIAQRHAQNLVDELEQMISS